MKNLNLDDWIEHIHPEDRTFVFERFLQARKAGGRNYIEYRLQKKDGAYIYVSDTGTYLKNEDGKPYRVLGVVKDITQKKQSEEIMKKIEITRKQEIHHRIKNNLQVIMSLLDLQAEKFRNKKIIRDSEVLEAFRVSQDRVISMALIHEELYKGGNADTINFQAYIKELTESLLLTYRVGHEDITLKTEIDDNIFFNMDTAVPLGIIINELVSNSLKHAFIGRANGEIRIKLHGAGERDSINAAGKEFEGCKATNFILSVSDNGIGISKELEIKNLESLGLQLVATLVEQLDGEFQVNRNNGTEFIIRFTERNQVPIF